MKFDINQLRDVDLRSTRLSNHATSNTKQQQLDTNQPKTATRNEQNDDYDQFTFPYSILSANKASSEHTKPQTTKTTTENNQ